MAAGTCALDFVYIKNRRPHILSKSNENSERTKHIDTVLLSQKFDFEKEYKSLI